MNAGFTKKPDAIFYYLEKGFCNRSKDFIWILIGVDKGLGERKLPYKIKLSHEH